MKVDKSIKEIAVLIAKTDDPEDPLLAACRQDERAGVKALLQKWERQFHKQQQLKEHFQEMSRFELEFRAQGFIRIAGIDEVGRGPLAGPVTAAAVILPADFYLPGLDDSKKIPETKREIFYDYIMEHAEAAGIGVVSSKEIDEINIYQASKKAMLDAIQDLGILPDYLLIDAMELDVPVPQLSLIKGDARSISIAAASIVAKVTRDRLMKEYAVQYPEYGFDQNMGYGTAAHLKAIAEHGLTPWHRRSFGPVKEYSEGH